MRRGFSLIELIVVVLIIGISAAILLPIFARSSCGGGRPRCQSQLKQISLTIKQYSADYDDRFPLVAVNSVPQSLPPYRQPFGWADAIQPYQKNIQIYQCPSERSGLKPTNDATQSQFTDYWFNSRLAGVEERKIRYLSNTFMLGDGNSDSDMTNGRYSIPKIPNSWIGDTKSPLYRHLDGLNFAFSDGHVKWIKTPTTPLDATVTPKRFSFEWK